MKRTLLLALLASTLSAGALAQEQDMFNEIDGLLEELESLTPQSIEGEIPPAILNPGEDPELENASSPVPSQNQSSAAADNPVERAMKAARSQKSEHDQSLSTRITELPPNTRFEFTQSLFIPAYKSGLMFIDGLPKYSIESGVVPVDVFEIVDEGSTACALISDKSYLKVSGANENKSPTFLEVESISFKEIPWRDEFKTVSRIVFKTKEAKVADETVSMEVVCRVNDDKHIRNYTLSEIDKGFGGLFEYKLPKYIEL